MARKASSKRGAPAAPQLPYGAGMHEVAYGAGVLPTIYNGQNSALAPQVEPPLNVLTNSGMNSPSAAASTSDAAGMYGSTQASLQPAGPGNPMSIFAAARRLYPLAAQQQDPAQASIPQAQTVKR